MPMVRCVFGPSREEIWRRLSTSVNGRHLDQWAGDRVDATHGEWTVTLDTYTVPVGKTFVQHTRMRAPFVNPDGFRFAISRRHLLSGFAAALGMQDIEIGDAGFDHDFVIKGNNESRVRALFADARIRSLIAAQRDIDLSVKDDEGWFGATFPDGVDELYFAVPGVIKDLDRLQQLYELFGAVLDRLCAIGSAYARAPGVSL